MGLDRTCSDACRARPLDLQFTRLGTPERQKTGAGCDGAPGGSPAVAGLEAYLALAERGAHRIIRHDWAGFETVSRTRPSTNSIQVKNFSNIYFKTSTTGCITACALLGALLCMSFAAAARDALVSSLRARITLTQQRGNVSSLLLPCVPAAVGAIDAQSTDAMERRRPSVVASASAFQQAAARLPSTSAIFIPSGSELLAVQSPDLEARVLLTLISGATLARGSLACFDASWRADRP